MSTRRTWDGGNRTGSELNQLVLNTICLATIPGIAVGSWYAIWAVGLPPHGPAGRWSALLLAALYGLQNLATIYLLVLSFAMDGSNQARQPVARPGRYLVKTAWGVLPVILLVNAPLTLILIIAWGIQTILS